MNGTTLALDNLIKSLLKSTFCTQYPNQILLTLQLERGSTLILLLPLITETVDFHFATSIENSLSMVGFGRMKINPPSTAFNNDINLGSCWPFNGPSGHVALTLGSVMSPTDLGLIHVMLTTVLILHLHLVEYLCGLK